MSIKLNESILSNVVDLFYSESTQMEIGHSKYTPWPLIARKHSGTRRTLGHSGTRKTLEHSGTCILGYSKGTWPLMDSSAWALEALEGLQNLPLRELCFSKVRKHQ